MKIRQSRGADGGTRADVCGEYRRKHQWRAQTPAGNEKVAALADVPRNPESADRQRGGIGDEQNEMNRHVRGVAAALYCIFDSTNAWIFRLEPEATRAEDGRRAVREER